MRPAGEISNRKARFERPCLPAGTVPPGSTKLGTLALIAAVALSGGSRTLADAPIVVARPGSDASFDIFDNSGNRIGGTTGASAFAFNPGEQLLLGDWNGDFFDEVNVVSALEGGSIFGYDQLGADAVFSRTCDNTGEFCRLAADCRAGSDQGTCMLQIGLNADNSAFGYAEGNAVFLADLDGDGIDEIVVARRAFDPGEASFDVFDRRGVRIGGGGQASDFAFGENVLDRYLIGAADTDGDGIDEIVVVVATLFADEARFDLYDAAGSRVGGAAAGADFSMGKNSPVNRFEVAAADLEGDGTEEIVVVVGTLGPADAHFEIYDRSGARVGGATDASDFLLGLDVLDQYRVRAGDVDGDGADEIVVAKTPFLDPDGATLDFYDESGNDEGGAGADSDFRLGGEDAFVIGTERFSPLGAGEDDSDGDGLFDVWETEGVRFGSRFLDLPALGADPMHRDLFLEVDWMEGRPPSQQTVREMIRAFALAPLDNPDGQTGIRLWVDTGSLVVGSEDGGAPLNSCRDGDDNGREDGGNPGTCSDDVDNGVDGLADWQDPDCDGLIDGDDPDCLGVEDEFLSSTCSDGIDNGGADGADALDPDCPKIEDGVGPSTCFDGVDNGGLDGADGLDPDCQGIEDRAGLGACLDGVNNGPDGDGADAVDPDCRVGHDLGGGNAVPFANVSSLTERFYEIKAANFDPGRRPAFHYVLMARFPTNDQGTSSGGNDATTLNDTGQDWLRNEWADRTVTITSGTASGQSRAVLSNGTTQLVLEDLEELRGLASSCADDLDNDRDGSVDGNDPDCTIPDDSSSYRISGTGGQAEIPGNDVVVFNQGWEAKSTLHEVGHNLGLLHGGDSDRNCKPNYVSVMSYDIPFGIPQNGGGFIFDFSPPRYFGGRGVAPLAELNETNLDESVILDATDPANRFVFTGFDPEGSEDGAGPGSCTDGVNNGTDLTRDGLDRDCRGPKIQAPLNGDWDGDGVGDGVDWNADGVIPNAAGFPLNIDDAGPDGSPTDCANTDATTIDGFDDWGNIVLDFRTGGEFDDAPVNPVPTPEPTDHEIDQALRQINTTDLSITLAAGSEPIEIGDDLVFTVAARNEGPNPAGVVRVESQPPFSAVLQGASSDCTAGTAGVLCLSGELAPGSTRESEFTVTTANTCVDGAPVELTATADVANADASAGADPDPGDNAATLTVTPQDTTPPELSVPEPLVVECSVAGGTAADNPTIAAWLASAVGTDACDDTPSITHDSPGFFLAGCNPATGTTTVTFTATDAAGNRVSRSSTLTVLDRLPPQVTVTPGSTCLWSPDGTLRTVGTFTMIDVCDPAPVSSVVVTSDEAPFTGGGTCPDGAVTLEPTVMGQGGVLVHPSGGVVQVRAERAGSADGGNGRVYGVVGVEGRDACGSAATAYLPVGSARDCPGAACVPRDQDPKSPGRTKGNAPGRCPAVDDGQLYDVAVCE